MDAIRAAGLRLADLLERIEAREPALDEDEIFEAMDELGAAHVEPRERAAALVLAVAPFCRTRPDLADELLRHPARPLDELGFTSAEWGLDWLEQIAAGSGEAPGIRIPSEVRRRIASLQLHLDQLREGRESWADPAAEPPPLLLAWRLAEEGRRTEAARLFEGLARGSEHPILYLFQAARLRAREGDVRPALDLLEEEGLPRIFRARLLALVGRRQGATEAIAAILEETPDYPVDEETDFEPLRGFLPFERLRPRGPAAP